MILEFSLKDSYRHFSLLLALLVAAALQGLHFYYYYDQTASNSIIWSLVDWSVWFFLIGALHQAYASLPLNQKNKNYWPVAIAVILMAGPFQIMISNTIYGLIFSPSRPFWDDFIHLYEKRWLQNLFYAGFLWQLFNFLWPFNDEQSAGLKKSNSGLSNSIKISDGKSVYWIIPEEIKYVESAGNYLLVFINEKKILIRKSLKQFVTVLPENLFLKINRSCLVNKNLIRRIEPYSKYSKQVVLNDGTVLKIGKTYLSKLATLLNE